MAQSVFYSNIRCGAQETDGQVFIHGSEFGFDVGTWTYTRGAAGNYFMRKTAAADTSHPTVNLAAHLFKKIGADPVLSGSPPGSDSETGNASGATRIRGFEITQIQVVYAIGTAAITTHTYDLHQTTYANEVAPSVDSTIGGTLTGALLTTTNAQPRATAITVGTPYVIGANTDLIADYFELTVVAAATSVYDLYGIFVDFDYVLL